MLVRSKSFTTVPGVTFNCRVVFSLYFEGKSSTVMGIVGLMQTAAPVTVAFKNAGRAVVLLGGAGTCDDIPDQEEERSHCAGAARPAGRPVRAEGVGCCYHLGRDPGHLRPIRTRRVARGSVPCESC